MAKLNIQQLPKRQGFLECWKPSPGKVLVYTDFSALEMKVAAAATRDKNLMKLYGPEANPAHDVYLFNAAHIPIWEEEVLKYYDLENPTKEKVAEAKKELKHIRNIAKPVTLGWQYGASGNRFHEELNLMGYKIDLDTCWMLKRSLDNTYPGLKKLEKRLVKEWRKNKGWFLNGRGIPKTLSEKYIKDIVNRYIQSTGHDLLMFYIRLLKRNFNRNRIQAVPWLVDEHDATVWEIPENQGPEAVDNFDLTFKELNRIIQFPVTFTGDTKIAYNLAELKCED